MDRDRKEEEKLLQRYLRLDHLAKNRHVVANGVR
jgi:hypothetical protein